MNLPAPIAKALAGHPAEKLTEALDGLRDRLQTHTTLYVNVAKWHAAKRKRAAGLGVYQNKTNPNSRTLLQIA